MRANQKARTRQAIVRAAGSLLRDGQKPTLEEIAEEARVSRATAYRYFPGLDALLNEATIDLLLPEADDLLGADAPKDPFERLALVDETFDQACREQEVPLRLMLARILEQSVRGADGEVPLRQNRRIPAVAKALAPLARQLGKARTERLGKALAMVVGTEGFLALKDVAGLDRDEAREVRRWAINALVDASLNEARRGS